MFALVATLVPGNGGNPSDNFGEQVAVTAAGDRVFVNAPSSGDGQVHIYSTTDLWLTALEDIIDSPIQQNTSPPSALPLFSQSVACSAAGTVMPVTSAYQQRIYYDLATLGNYEANVGFELSTCATSSTGVITAFGFPTDDSINVYKATPVVGEYDFLATYAVRSDTNNGFGQWVQVNPGGTQMMTGAPFYGDGTLEFYNAGTVDGWVTLLFPTEVLSPPGYTHLGGPLTSANSDFTLVLCTLQSSGSTTVVRPLTTADQFQTYSFGAPLAKPGATSSVAGVAVSPDGTTWAVAYSTPGSPSSIYIYSGTGTVRQILHPGVTVAVPQDFTPEGRFQFSADGSLFAIGDPSHVRAYVFSVRAPAPLVYSCDAVVGGPPQDAQLSYVAQLPSAVSGRPPSDAVFSALRVGPARALGLVAHDHAWNVWRSCV